VFRVDYGHAEVQHLFGADPRRYETLTKRFVTDENNNLTGLETVRVEWTSKGGKWSMEEVPNSKEVSAIDYNQCGADNAKVLDADICLLALGFLGPSKYLLEQFGVETDVRGNVKTAHGVRKRIARATHSDREQSYETSVPGIFTAGDCRRGQSESRVSG
jgi:NADPH-dependent glutamate synthase beta subunit-like oxidoreductase